MSKGVRYQGRKLTLDDVLSMGKLWRQGATAQEIADKHGVTCHCVDDILSGRTWGGLGKVRDARGARPNQDWRRGKREQVVETTTTEYAATPTAVKMTGAGGDGKTARMATPPEATLALLDAVTFTNEVWEPTCGQGVMAETLKSRGYTVFASDVHDYGYQPSMVFDFFDAKSTIADTIIANIDFCRTGEFIKHALSLNPVYLAVLVRATYWHAGKRLPWFRAYTPWLVLPLTFRPDFNGSGSPVVEFLWIVWKRGYTGKAALYYPLDRPETVDERLNTLFMTANDVAARDRVTKTRVMRRGFRPGGAKPARRGAHHPRRKYPSDYHRNTPEQVEERRRKAIELLAETPGLSTEKMADALGCHPLGLTRTLTLLSEQGLVARTQPHIVGFGSPWALTERGDQWLTNYRNNTGGNGDGQGR